MSYAKDRDQFLVTMAGQPHPLSLDTLRLLLRYSTTLTRLAEAQCNGDWPSDNGERKTRECPRCQGSWVPSSFKPVTTFPESESPMDGDQPARVREYVCPDCYASARVEQLLSETAWQPYIQGDPRGYVLRLFARGTSQDDMYCGRAPYVGVPSSR